MDFQNVKQLGQVEPMLASNPGCLKRRLFKWPGFEAKPMLAIGI